jgi:hypothetical protein
MERKEKQTCVIIIILAGSLIIFYFLPQKSDCTRKVSIMVNSYQSGLTENAMVLLLHLLLPLSPIHPLRPSHPITSFHLFPPSLLHCH